MECTIEQACTTIVLNRKETVALISRLMDHVETGRKDILTELYRVIDAVLKE